MNHNNNTQDTEKLIKQQRIVIDFCLENRFRVKNGKKPMCPDILTEKLKQARPPQFNMELDISKMYQNKCDYEIKQNKLKLNGIIQNVNNNINKKKLTVKKINNQLCSFEQSVDNFN